MIELTPDIQVTDDSRALSANLGNDPARIFYHVLNNFEFEPYYFGSLKGSQETLLQKAGNDYDLASLLIALLHSANVQARYVQTTVSVSIADAMSWVGVENAQVAEQILTVAGYKVTSISNGAVTTALELPHVWVEALLPGKDGQAEWVPLDPSFKQHTIMPGRDIAGDAGLSKTELIQTVLARTAISEDGSTFMLPNVDTLNAVVRRRVSAMHAYLNNVEPALTLNQMIGGKQIVQTPVSALPTEALETKTPVGRFDVIAGSDRHYLRVFFQGINTTLALPTVASKRITLSFVAATSEDQARIDSFGGILRTPAFAVSMKPQLKADDVVQAEGFGLGLGASFVNFLQLTFLRGPFTTLDSVTHPNLAVGGHYAIMLDTQAVSSTKLKRAADRLDAAKAAVGTEAFSEELTPQLLYTLGLVYFAYQNRFTEYAAGTQNAIVFHSVNEALLAQDLDIEIGTQRVVPYFYIDNKRNAFEIFSRSGDQTFDAESLRFAVFYGSSGLEDSFFRLAAGLPAISTTSIFEEAAYQQTPIRLINEANVDEVLPQVRVSPLVRGSLSTAISQGRDVLIPEEPTQLLDWAGSGWIERPLASTLGGFLISRSRNGGQSMFSSARLSFEKIETLRTQVAEFSTAFIAKNALGIIDRTPYDTPASQLGAASGELVGGLLGYGDVVNGIAGSKLCFSMGGGVGCDVAALSAIAAIPIFGDAKNVAKFVDTVDDIVLDSVSLARKHREDGIPADVLKKVEEIHGPNSTVLDREVSTWNEDVDPVVLTQETLKEEHLISGKTIVQPNGNRPGFQYYHEFPDFIGKGPSGDTKWWRVVLRPDGNIELAPGEVFKNPNFFPDHPDPLLAPELN